MAAIPVVPSSIVAQRAAASLGWRRAEQTSSRTVSTVTKAAIVHACRGAPVKSAKRRIRNWIRVPRLFLPSSINHAAVPFNPIGRGREDAAKGAPLFAASGAGAPSAVSCIVMDPIEHWGVTRMSDEVAENSYKTDAIGG